MLTLLDFFKPEYYQELSVNIVLCEQTDQERKQPREIRYFQIGICDEYGFTGLIGDYVGGGEFQDDFVFLHHRIIKNWDDHEIEERIELVEQAYPHLFDDIYKLQQLLMKFDENTYWFVETPLISLLESKGNIKTNNVQFEPLEVANTIFS